MNPQGVTNPTPSTESVTQPSQYAVLDSFVERLSNIIANTANPRERAAKVAELKAKYQKDVFGIAVKVED